LFLGCGTSLRIPWSCRYNRRTPSNLTIDRHCLTSSKSPVSHPLHCYPSPVIVSTPHHAGHMRGALQELAMKTLGSQGPCRVTIGRAALTLSSHSKRQRYAMHACWPRVAVLASWASPSHHGPCATVLARLSRLASPRGWAVVASFGKRAED
jgi:hypothetical protein